MVNPLYSWTFRDPFHPIFIETTTTMSIASNAFLILIAFLSSAGQQIGSYRYLLAFFALCDIWTSIGHAVVQPYVHLTSAGFYFFPRHGGRELFGKPFDTISVLFFIATYYQTFLVLAFHFVYRYKTVTRGLHSSFNSRWGMPQWILMGTTVNVIYIGAFLLTVAIGMTPSPKNRDAVPHEIFDIYGVNLKDEHYGFTVMAVRTAVPCVFSYAPLAVCLMWPFTGISLGAFGNVLFLITAIFPSIDAFFVLYFIRSFRAAIIRIFRLPFDTGSVIEPSETEHTKTVANRI
ncbi:hypothetical protein PRIPAC_77397 [Pristionchus pacificus]|uniref:G protein-coupled receptor n=1 Tax=Pristionchus pacificus TaxID=54126 RepID=A0A2A6CL15_PRIPA|nr:hypothetical protein PRIPAC_77397 [Pristionchus pacificus]|eukprot:PDM78892.1 G protein-coupled receptor [Pristionchus pacificus]